MGLALRVGAIRRKIASNRAGGGTSPVYPLPASAACAASKLAKNTAQLHTLFALANLYRVRPQLWSS